MPAVPVALAALVGVVFVDQNRDGLYSAGEHGAAGVAVFADDAQAAVTGPDGRFELNAPDSAIIWARSPDGFGPAPVWVTGTKVELPLAPRPPASHTFVQMADLHVGIDGFDADDAARALARATRVSPAPDFLVVTGDMTNGTQDEEFGTLDHLVAGLDVPFVPVPGNHDWHDGGPAYRKRFGPPMYSFDADGAHFIVLNFNDSIDHQLAFVHLDLATGHIEGRVIVFTHAPPPDRLLDGLVAAGVDDVFSGHVHSNHITDAGGLVEYNTEPPVMGGLDHTPAGYRVVSLSDGLLTVSHRTTTEAQVAWVFPEEDYCLDPAHPDLVISATATPQLRVDDHPVALTPAGGWAYVARVADLSAGFHHARLGAQDIDFRVCTPQPMDERPRRPWLQTQNGPRHEGATALALAPPLELIWATPTGGHLEDGTTLITDALVIAGVTDLGDGRAGGVIAVDRVSGQVRWKHPILGAVRGTLAAAGDAVVAGDTSGRVTALRLADGKPLWQVDLGAANDAADSWLYAPPTIEGGVVHVGIQPRQAALDLVTGEVLWTTDQTPAYGPLHAAPAVGDGVVVMPVGHNHGQVLGLDAATGALRWHQDDPIGKVVEASPLLVDGSVFVANTEGKLYRLASSTGVVEWERTIYDWHGHWGWGPLGTPAYADGRLYLPTPHDGLFAIDAASGEIAWTVQAARSRVRPDPYENATSGFQTSPIVSGDLVWIAGGDGLLRALDRKSGAPRWQKDVGMPVLTSVTTDGQLLVVAGYDGVLRGYARRSSPTWSLTSGGCQVGHGAKGLPWLLLALLVLRSCSPFRARLRSSAARPRGTRRRPAWRPRGSPPADGRPPPSA
jgi:outer membrane protein assembly factor BamB